MAMSNLRYLATTTILGMVLSYALHQYHGEDSHRSQDCSVYDKGKGLDTDGKPFQDMAAFYPYYLCEHVNPTTKLIHFIATFNALSLMGKSIIGEWQWAGLGLALVQGYGLAWYSHFMVEQNKPATWQYPWMSYKSDNKLFYQSLMGIHKLW
eukprot:TRINITY_DN13017_c0_g1_i1.p1 TRINITY_DN13017_c0_g1~~TRINITY_DN13017_c0_g1_i1.p1  ORF type:complete len:152 (-),score=37.01 TRINITY_DN13017_c0_g1_i1:27-482(-)